MLKRCVGGWLTVAALLAAAGCGGGSDQGKLRVMNASPNESGLDVLVDGKSIATGIAYGNNSDYISVASGSRHVQIEASGTTTILIDQNVSVASSGESTVLATNLAADISALVLIDDATAPATGDASLRVVNASPTLGSVDVYVVAPGADLVASTPVIRNLAFNAATDYQTLTAGSFEVVMTAPGTTIPLLDTGALNLTAGQNRTVVSMDGVSGGFTATVLSDLN
ncbi:MAG TPA: DUF4397 domain-containing protein [Terriglobales bacterium]|jgi:hypothetical protein|nr:DUF4397 domain-containing protein [Terriglobales bacterium]